MAFLESNSDLWGKQVSSQILDPRTILETLLKNSTDAVLLIDSSGRVLALNKEAEKLYEINEQEAIGHLLGSEVCLLKPHLDMLNELIKHAVQNRDELVNKDVTIVQSNGKQKHFNIRTSLLTDINGQKHPQLILALRDTTLNVKSAREHSESAIFFAAIVVALLISKSADNWVLTNATSIDIHSNTFVWIYTAAVCTPMLAYLLWIKRPVSEFGVTLKNWKQSLIEGITITGLLLLLGALGLILLGIKEGKDLTDYINADWLKVETLAYIPHSIIQEFIFRGVVLTTLLHMFRASSLWQPLLLSNLLFSFLHLHLGVAAVFITFMIGLLFSWMYLRHKNILGISLAHIVLGSSAFLFSVL